MEARLAHLLDVASAEFLAQGYAAASLVRIARTAGVSGKTIYARFAGKDVLLSAVVARLTEASKADLADLLADPAADPSAVLTEFGLAIARRWSAPLEVGLYRLLIAECPRFPHLCAIYRQTTDRYDGVLATYLAGLADRGVLRVDQPERDARAFVQLVGGEVRERVLLSEAMQAEESETFVRRAVALFLHGCRVHADR